MSFAAVGASILSSVYAAPLAQNQFKPSSTSQSTAPSSTAVAFLNDGFPSPNPAQLLAIEELAHGTIPNGPPPAKGAISAQGILNLQFVNYNENLEVNFFSSLLHNITTNVDGFKISDNKERDFVIEVITAVLAVSLLLLSSLDDPF
jgi:hypothetical protein